MGIDTFLHHEVLSVDPAARRVRVRDNDSGREFEDTYDALMIAVGCDSVAPKVPGADLPSVFYLKTMEDGLLLREIARLHGCAPCGGGGRRLHRRGDDRGAFAPGQDRHAHRGGGAAAHPV